MQTAEDTEILDIVKKHPGINSPEIRKLLSRPISQPTLSRRIERLEREGLLRREGAGRRTVYFLASPLDFLKRPHIERQKVGYNFEWVERFQPNVDQFFTANERAEMHAAGESAGVAPTLFAQRIHERFMIDLSFASSKMEGNTYSLLDTERLIKFGERAQGKAIEETTMILNHKDAIAYMLDHVMELQVSTREIKNIHALLSKDLVEDGEPGTIRNRIVGIEKSAYQPISVPSQLNEQFALLISKAAQIEDPYEQSIFLMTTISYLQPFIDVNKRTGRLASNIPLLRNSLCPLSFREVDKDAYLSGLLLFYETNRTGPLKDAYYSGYIKSAQQYKIYNEQSRREVTRLDVAYRQQIKDGVRQAIAQVVDHGMRDLEGFFDKWLTDLPEADRAPVAQRIRQIVERLTEDNAIAYGVSLDLFERWKSKKQVAPDAG